MRAVPAGAFDAATTGVLDQAIGRARMPRIVVDCSAVTFADVAFLRVLCERDSHGTRVVVTAPSRAVRRLLDATGTTTRFLAAGDSAPASWSCSGADTLRAG